MARTPGIPNESGEYHKAGGMKTGNPASLKTGADGNGRGNRAASSGAKAAGRPDDVEPDPADGAPTVLETAFAHQYVIWGNATKAAKLAGYSEKTSYSTGSKLLRVPRVAKLISLLLAEAAAEFRGTREAIIHFLLTVIYSDTTDLLKVEKDAAGKLSVQFKETNAFDNGTGRLINSITVGRTGLKIEIFSKKEAIDMYNRMMGFYEKDNAQKAPTGPTFYMPDNGRGVTEDPPALDSDKDSDNKTF